MLPILETSYMTKNHLYGIILVHLTSNTTLKQENNNWQLDIEFLKITKTWILDSLPACLPSLALPTLLRRSLFDWLGGARCKRVWSQPHTKLVQLELINV